MPSHVSKNTVPDQHKGERSVIQSYSNWWNNPNRETMFKIIAINPYLVTFFSVSTGDTCTIFRKWFLVANSITFLSIWQKMNLGPLVIFCAGANIFSIFYIQFRIIKYKWNKKNVFGCYLCFTKNLKLLDYKLELGHFFSSYLRLIYNVFLL